MKNLYIEKEEYAELIINSNTHGSFRLFVDLDDLERLKSVSWSVDIKQNGMVYFRGGTSGRFYLHRFILDNVEDGVVDHINRNTLDNRKSNLRTVDSSINNFNRGIRSDNTSGVSGVSFNSTRQAYRVRRKGKDKWFSVSKYGDTALEMATQYRLSLE